MVKKSEVIRIDSSVFGKELRIFMDSYEKKTGKKIKTMGRACNLLILDYKKHIILANEKSDKNVEFKEKKLLFDRLINY